MPEAEYTGDLLRLNTKYTESSQTKHTEFLLRPKTTIPNLSYVRNRRYRTNQTYQSFLTFEPKDTEDFLQFFCRLYSFFSTKAISKQISWHLDYSLPTKNKQLTRVVFASCQCDNRFHCLQ